MLNFRVDIFLTILICVYLLSAHSSCVKLTQKIKWSIWDTWSALNLTEIFQLYIPSVLRALPSFFIDTCSDRDVGVLTEITNSLVTNNFHSATVTVGNYFARTIVRWLLQFEYSLRYLSMCLFIEEHEYYNCKTDMKLITGHGIQHIELIYIDARAISYTDRHIDFMLL